MAPQRLVNDLHKYVAYAALAYCKLPVRNRTSLIEPIDSILDPATKTYAQIYFDRRDGEIVVSFRGSESISKLAAAYSDEKEPLYGALDMFVNKNAQTYTLAIRQELVDTLASLRRKHGHCRVILVGHSLGGSIATLMAPLLVSSLQLTRASLRIITFCQPRVGDEGLTRYYNRLNLDFTRVTNKDDPDHPPAADGWAHVHREVYVDHGNNFHLCGTRALDDPACSWGKTNPLALLYRHNRMGKLKIFDKFKHYLLSKDLAC